MATTTNYSWTTPDNTSYVKDGASAIRTLGSSVDTTLFTALGGAYPGLRLVKKQTVGSGVSSVTVTSAFSATYENYKIIYTGGVGSTNATYWFNLGASVTGYNGILSYGQFASSSGFTANDNNAAQFSYSGGGDANAAWCHIDIMNPNVARFTRIQAIYQNSTDAGTYNGVHKVATAYTDFKITPSPGTLTGGTIYVYGYGAS